MKQLLLILAFLLPLCAYPQLKEPFNGPEITSDNPCLLYTSDAADE